MQYNINIKNYFFIKRKAEFYVLTFYYINEKNAYLQQTYIERKYSIRHLKK